MDDFGYGLRKVISSAGYKVALALDTHIRDGVVERIAEAREVRSRGHHWDVSLHAEIGDIGCTAHSLRFGGFLHFSKLRWIGCNAHGLRFEGVLVFTRPGGGITSGWVTSGRHLEESWVLGGGFLW